MTGMILLALAAMLLRPALVMDAAGDACRLFALSVMPGLLPYMTLTALLQSRMKQMRPGLLLLMGWGGGSPTGARLLARCPGLSRAQQVRLAVSCATMSPMFLRGTVGGWLGSGWAGTCVLLSVLVGGWLAGLLAGCVPGRRGVIQAGEGSGTLSLGQAVEQTMRTLLMVCGTMALWRVLAALAGESLGQIAPMLTLPLTVVMEVTTGTAQLAALPLPLPLRTAMIAGATGFGGMAVLMQNRAAWPGPLMPLWEQALWQAVHGGLTFLLALGMMLMTA